MNIQPQTILATFTICVMLLGFFPFLRGVKIFHFMCGVLALLTCGFYAQLGQAAIAFVWGLTVIVQFAAATWVSR